jgi:hypothetical protein
MSRHSPSKHTSFKDIFNSAVDRAMLSIGETGREMVYYYLEKTFGIKEQWHNNLEGFAEALEQIFGPGAQLLLRAIVKELYTDLNLKIEEPKQFHFANIIRKAEQHASERGCAWNGGAVSPTNQHMRDRRKALL